MERQHFVAAFARIADPECFKLVSNCCCCIFQKKNGKGKRVRVRVRGVFKCEKLYDHVGLVGETAIFPNHIFSPSLFPVVVTVNEL